MSSCDGRPFASLPQWRVEAPFFFLSLSLGVSLWWFVVVAFYLSCLFAPCHDAGQVDEHGLYHDDNSCTIAVHRCDVEICQGTNSTLLMKYEQHENYDLCCVNFSS